MRLDLTKPLELIKNKDIPVVTVQICSEAGMTPYDIVETFPELTIPEVIEAISAK
jgi:uncharacterized protein (DUF433 family)